MTCSCNLLTDRVARVHVKVRIRSSHHHSRPLIHALIEPARELEGLLKGLVILVKYRPLVTLLPRLTVPRPVDGVVVITPSTHHLLSPLTLPEPETEHIESLRGLVISPRNRGLLERAPLQVNTGQDLPVLLSHSYNTALRAVSVLSNSSEFLLSMMKNYKLLRTGIVCADRPPLDDHPSAVGASA